MGKMEKEKLLEIHICSTILDLKGFLEDSLELKNKGLRSNISMLVDSMNKVHDQHLASCINKKEENSHYFT